MRENFEHGELQAAYPKALTEHCEKCPACKEYSNQLISLRQLLAGQGRVLAPANYDLKLRQRIAASQKTVNPGWFVWISQPMLGTAAAAIILIGTLVGLDTYMTKHSQPVSPSTASVTESKSNSSPVNATAKSAVEDIAKTLPPSKPLTDATVNANESKVNEPKSVEPKAGGDVASLENPGTLRRGNAGRSVSINAVSPGARSPRTSTPSVGGLPVSMVVYGAQPVLKIVNSDDIEQDGNNGSGDDTSIF